jgi:hypothetical protein
MPSFDFCYLDAEGALTCTVAALCADETEAKVFAHAMKADAFKQIEVWQDEKLVYARPERHQRSSQRAISEPARPATAIPAV